MSKKMGRPRIEIDQKAFESLCGIQCTQQEIADYFDCDADTIERWCKRTYQQTFAVVFRQKRGKGKVSLRRSQWRQATEKENITMLIWLGKQFLNQTDKVVMADGDLKHTESEHFKDDEAS